MRRRTILGGGAVALGLLAVVCIPRHLPPSVSQAAFVPANFYARLEPGQLTFRGSLPDTVTRDRILQQARALYEGMPIRLVDQLTVDPQVTPASWMSPLPAILPLLQQMDGRGSIIVDGRSIVLSGQTISEESKTVILQIVSPMTSIGLVLEDHMVSDSKKARQLKLQSVLSEFLSRHPIDFESNQYRLTLRSRQALDRLGSLLRQYPPATIEIGGHTDSYGEPEYNKDLSRKRAETVRQYLLDHGAQHQFTTVGYGDSKPVTSKKSRHAVQRNRRIEFLVQGSRNL